MSLPAPRPGWLTTARANAALAALGALSLGLYARGSSDIAALRIPHYAAGALALGVLYAGAAWLVLRAPAARSTWVLALVFAAGFRLVALCSPSYLSTDLYRYIWDGRVQAAGINPYRHVPADPALANLRDPVIYPKINRKNYARTIYPPVAQMFYLGVTRLTESVTGMRLAMIACEAAALWAIARLLASYGLPLQRTLLYAWHPLAAWEFAGGGHIDALMIALLALAFLAHRKGRHGAVGGWLAGAVLVKLFPAILFPALWRRWNWRMPAVFASVAVAAYAPYVWTFNLRGVLGFLPGYSNEEGLQSGDRYFLLNLIPGLHPLPIFLAIAGLAMAGSAVWIFFAPARDERSFLRRCLALATLFMLILSPGYDWYYTWLIPFACFLPGAWLLWITCAASILYLNWDLSELSDVFLQNCFIFLPAALLGLFPLLRRRFIPSLADS